jgi:hypothetical protein
LTAGTVLDGTKPPLRSWFVAIYLVSQNKTGLSSLARTRHLGTAYRTAWLVHHKLVVAMAARDALEPLAGNVQLDVPTSAASALAWVGVARCGWRLHPGGHRQLSQGRFPGRLRRSQRRSELLRPRRKARAPS